MPPVPRLRVFLLYSQASALVFLLWHSRAALALPHNVRFPFWILLHKSLGSCEVAL